jgi:hypothetical protein
MTGRHLARQLHFYFAGGGKGVRTRTRPRALEELQEGARSLQPRASATSRGPPLAPGHPFALPSFSSPATCLASTFDIRRRTPPANTMEGKGVVMSALGIGIGVGVGLGLASAPWAAGGSAPARDGLTVERLEQELRRLLTDGAHCKVTFDDFPYYLRFSFSFRRLLLLSSIL